MEQMNVYNKFPTIVLSNPEFDFLYRPYKGQYW